jgi:hypothetical protein
MQGKAFTMKYTAFPISFWSEIGDVTVLAGERVTIDAMTPVNVSQQRGARILVHVCPPNAPQQAWAWVEANMLTA